MKTVSGLLAFLLRRVSVCAALCMVGTVILYGADAMAMCGVLGGALLSVYKAAFLGMVPVWFTRKKPRAFFLYAFMSQIISVAALTAAVFISKRLFVGLAAGLLATAAVICVNALTERLGITHNRWGMGAS